MTTFFATTPKGIEPLLAMELRQWGADNIIQGKAGVSFTGKLATAYRVCLWSRVANRVLLNLSTFPANDTDSLYAGVRSVDWSQHMYAHSSLAVNAHSAQSALSHSQFIAQRVKDAIVDQFRSFDNIRPSVDRHSPDIRINVYVFKNRVRLSLDLSGESLHRRGYRQSGGGAPLKENLAAALLLFVDWPDLAKSGAALCDPMCGSGTLLIEAATIAADIAPALQREQAGSAAWGFSNWRRHQPEVWKALVEEARQRRCTGLKLLTQIVGSDQNPKLVNIAKANITAAGLGDYIRVHCADIAQLDVDASQRGLIITNPPYGERLNTDGTLAALYSSMGQAFRCALNWRIAVFSGNPALAYRFRLPQRSALALKNGAIACRLLMYQVPVTALGEGDSTTNQPVCSESAKSAVAMFTQRLKKNKKSLSSWCKSTAVSCYRIYDADLPDFALAIDLFNCLDGLTRVHLQEYAPPKTVDADRAKQRLDAALKALPTVLECDPQQIHVKVRYRQRGNTQYKKLARRDEFHAVEEGGCKLWVNFVDYQDCGLFLDHRKVRQKIYKLARGKRFLNLFAYTGAASVYAALGGARSVTSVDMSSAYLDWMQKNFGLNQLAPSHYEFILADCLQWLQAAQENARRYDLILLDPPTFSNSKRMDQTWEVQRDHAAMIHQAMHLLADDGLLLFSCNRKKFALDDALQRSLACREISRQTVSRDFLQSRVTHRCWAITRRE